MPASMSRSRSKPMPSDRLPGEALGQATERLGPAVDHGHGVAPADEVDGETAAHPAATHDYDVHVDNLLGQGPAAILTRRAEAPGHSVRRHAKLTGAMYSTLKRVLIGRRSRRRGASPAADQDHRAWPSSRPTRSPPRPTPPTRSSACSCTTAVRRRSRTLVPIAVIVAILLAIVVTSYRQTIFAYPSGGGSYIVSRENLGETPRSSPARRSSSTTSSPSPVSVAAWRAGHHLGLPELGPPPRADLPGFVALMTRGQPPRRQGVGDDLRRRRPTSTSRSRCVLIASGLYRSYVGHISARCPSQRARLHELDRQNARPLGLVHLALRAFSSGAVALSGVEAISERRARVPEARVARTPPARSRAMAIILGTAFFGVSLLRPPPQARSSSTTTAACRSWPTPCSARA